MRRLLGVLLAFALVLATRSLLVGAPMSGAQAVMALGFVLIVSFIVGQWVNTRGLPAVTGYLVVGMVFGPYLLGLAHPLLSVLQPEAVDALRTLDAVALGLIALSAGGELHWASVRSQLGPIGAVILGQTTLVFAAVAAGVLLLQDWLPQLAALDTGQIWAAALVFGAIATANSPATVLAVIKEAGARGPMTDLVLAVTVAKDVVVISLFTVVLAVAIMLVRPGAGFDAAFLLTLAWEVAGSVLAGLLLAGVVIAYQALVKHELPVVVLAVAFTAVTLLPQIHLSGLLACMVAGFVIENFSPHGDDLMRAIERHALPVYVVFFTIAGASLDLGALAAAWGLAAMLMLLRLAATVVGTMAGAGLTRAEGGSVPYGWSAFVAQAGVTLGLAVVVGQRFPEMGPLIQTATLGVIALNQLAGPVLFRLGLGLAGEVGQRGV